MSIEKACLHENEAGTVKHNIKASREVLLKTKVL